mgnify:CR=1 FL=1
MSAEFELTIATPLSVGWYDPALVDRHFYIRPTSVKGIWRWWARAFALGALFEAGCPDLKAASDLVAKWGFGTTGSASAYRITVEVREPPRVRAVRRRQRSGIQRLDLIALKRDVEYAEGGRFALRVEGRGRYFDHALRILAVALTLSGVGKGSRKSLGVLDITAARGDAPREQGVRDLIEAVKREAARDAACAGRAQRAELPPAPAVARDAFEVYSAKAGFQEVHGFFLRPNRARAASGSYSAPDPMDHMAWFFGLPRSQKGTGYMLPGEDRGSERGKEFRRASAIFAAAHGDRHIYGKGTYISIFLSLDWPDQLKWVGGSGTRNIRIDAVAVRKARDLFLQLVQSRWGLQRVWP